MSNITTSEDIKSFMQSADKAAAIAYLGGTPAANLVWCGPATGSAAAPTFRALVAADIPALNYSTFSGAYADLSGKPTLFDGTYAALSGKPDLSVAAITSGTVTNNNAFGGTPDPWLRLFRQSDNFTAFSVSNTGLITCYGGIASSSSVSILNGNSGVVGTISGILFDSSSICSWSHNTNVFDTPDTFLFRAAANTIGIGTGAGGAIRLKSPDGTAYNITVANGGAVTSTAA